MNESEDALKKYVDDLTEAIVEDLREGYTSELEPFEAYAQRVRSEVHSNLDEFRKRFLRGYEVIIKEISIHLEEQNMQGDQPPPGAIRL